MSGHTPGPWRITGYAYVSDCRTPMRAVAITEPPQDTCIRWEDGGIERSANAHLIAAAPELLAACEAALALLEAYPHKDCFGRPVESAFLRAAVRKARGE